MTPKSNWISGLGNSIYQISFSGYSQEKLKYLYVYLNAEQNSRKTWVIYNPKRELITR
jgi:hypothetical protein